jgi:hypothetical protein
VSDGEGVVARSRAAFEDPLVATAAIAGVCIFTAFAAFAGAWVGVSGTVVAGVQTAYLVSGGIGGLTLLVVGSTLLHIQLSRRYSALERQHLDRVLVEARRALERAEAAPGG